MNSSRPLAFAQLLRLPNVFTAFADVLMAACALGWIGLDFPKLALLLLASGCLYLAGMAWNDVFDRKDDAIHRSNRPIPSGRVSVRTAAIIAIILIVFGVTFAGIATAPDLTGVVLGSVLAALILLYDSAFKHYWIGPVAMGGCRFLNVLIPALAVPTPVAHEWLPYHVASVIGVYIVGVTLFARTEEIQSKKWLLIAATAVMGIAVVLALAVPLHFVSGTVPIYYPYLLAAFAFLIGFPIVRAIKNPTPKNVQAAVKRCIFGLVALDAILATAFVGWPGLLILLLLLPALGLGRWVYST